MAIDNKIT